MGNAVQIFRKSDGSHVELSLNIHELAERVVAGRIVLDDGTEAVRDVPEELRREYRAHDRGQRRAIAKWPLHSEALAVNRSDVAEVASFDRQNGVPTNYDHQGRPVFTSQKHRKDYCRLHGYFDRNAGYGDPAPLNR
jgi:hypothetical protein